MLINSNDKKYLFVQTNRYFKCLCTNDAVYNLSDEVNDTLNSVDAWKLC